MVQINMREMLEAGVHFGHQVRRWNPKMKPFIFGKKNGIYIIDLQTSIEMFKTALQFISDQVVAGKDALIVGTKKQAQSIIEEIAEETGMHYVNKRWLGGLLTNFSMIKKSIDRLLELDEMKKDGRWEVKSKKEQSRLEKVYKKLYRSLWGIRRMTSLPGVVIVIDSTFEDIAINEAKRMNIPIVAVVDTNANPEDVPFPSRATTTPSAPSACSSASSARRSWKAATARSRKAPTPSSWPPTKRPPTRLPPRPQPSPVAAAAEKEN